MPPSNAIQFGHVLDRILHKILLADPTMGPIYLPKLDISDGFYRINLAIEDIPHLGVVFPVAEGEEPLVAFPLVLPMGWTISLLLLKLLQILLMLISKVHYQYQFIPLEPLLPLWMTPF